MSTKTWIELAPFGPHPAGDVGGDVQRSDAFSRRWYRPATEGGYLVIDVAVYVASPDVMLDKPIGGDMRPWHVVAQTGCHHTFDLSDLSSGEERQTHYDHLASAAATVLHNNDHYPRHYCAELDGPLHSDWNGEP